MHGHPQIFPSSLPRCWRSFFLGRWRVLLAGWWLLSGVIGNLAAQDAPAGAAEGARIYRLETVPPDAKVGLGAWIWADKTFDHQSCRFWREFEIPRGATVVQARLRIVVDDGYQLYLDGRELAQGANWRSITEYDLAPLLKPGRHVLAINAFNDYLAAGMILSLQVTLADGKALDIKSDDTWKIVPNDVRNWETLKRAQPGWPSAALIEPHPFWVAERWPEDYVRVPPFQPRFVPFWQTGWFQVVLVSVCGGVLFICMALIFQLMLHSKGQRLLNQERARIARDIHDDFGTRLTGLILEGEMARSELMPDAKAGARLTRITDGLRQALSAMDEVLWAVNPRRDTVPDFVTYLCGYAQGYLKPAGILCLLEVQPDIPPLRFDLPLRRSLLLAVKEAITNVARHSGAEQMVLSIQFNDGNVVVVVEDNGKGFDPAQSGGRNGVGNMIHRMKEVGGDCRIISAPGAGCRIEFNIPLARRRPRLGALLRGVVGKRGRGPAPGASGTSDGSDSTQ